MTNTDKLHEWYRLVRRREFLKTHDKEQAWNAIQQRIRHRKNVKLWRKYGSIAAMALLMCGATLWWTGVFTHSSQENMMAMNKAKHVDGDNALMQRMSKDNGAQTTTEGENRIVSVPMGSNYAESLPDGTKVMMNSGAKLTYNQSLDGSRREVKLEGEAYFEVSHDAHKPFVVNTLSGSIEVLGTHFNVVAKAEMTTVTLQEGSVRLHFGDRQFVMKPGEQARMTTNGEIDIHHVNTANYTSWSTGTYEFTDVPLDDITRQLSLWYNIDINIADEELNNRRYTGIIMRNEPLENAINMLTTISDIKIETEDNNITLHSK